MINVVEKLSQTEKGQLKNGVIQVYGSAMNRTALGIVDAFLTLNPKATYAELKSAFPDAINASCSNRFKNIFVPFTDKPYGVFQEYALVKEIEKAGFDAGQSHFIEENEIFTTGDGKKIMVSKVWESSDSVNKTSDLQGLIDKAKEYGIKVVDFEPRKPFKKGKYQLEVINPVLFEKLTTAAPAKKSPILFVVMGAILLLGLLAFLFLGKKDEASKPAEPTMKDTVANVEPSKVVVEKPVEPISLKQISDSIKMGIDMSGESVNFQNIHFEKAKATLLPTSDSALLEIYNFLSSHSDVEVKIIGHCSEEGSADFNQKLSTERARSVCKYLIGKGIKSERLIPDGKGSSEPLIADHNEEAYKENRRVQVLIK